MFLWEPLKGRLGNKIDQTNEKVDKALTLASEANNALEGLKLKVGATEAIIDKRVGEAEARIQVGVEEKVKHLVMDQLRNARL